jgi:glycosyltransferase involved in cell wall biosynthesis
VAIIKSIDSSKIKFKQYSSVDRKGLVKLRNQQMKLTKTPWFLLLDGDEIWPEKNLIQLIKGMKNAKKQTIALVNRTRNCIGDIYHYLPESKGQYRIGPWQGHLNIRVIRKVPGLKVIGQYPLEAYTYQTKPLQNQPDKLEFVDTWYLHLTHLQRSGWLHQLNVIDRLTKFKFWQKRLKLKPDELPQVLR